MKSTISKDMIANQGLENCLKKAIYACKVRDMLTKFGIPEDAEVVMEMLFGTNPKPKASCLVPTFPKKDNVATNTSMSLESLRSCLREDFFNQAIYNYGLDKYLPEVPGGVVTDDNKVTIKLITKSPEFSFDFGLILACCGQCPWGWCAGC